MRQQSEERLGTGEEVVRILHTCFLSSFPSACSFALSYPHHMREGKRDGEEDEAGRMTDSLGGGCPVVAGCWSIGGEVVAMWWRLHRPELDDVDARPSP